MKSGQTKLLDERVKVCQIIFGTLIVGPVIAGLLLGFTSGFEVNQKLELLSIFGVVVAVASLIASFIVPGLHQNGMIKQIAQGKIPGDSENVPVVPAIENLSKQDKKLFSCLSVFQTSNIIRYALVVVAVFANIMFWALITHSVYNLIAALILIAVLIVFFPTRQRVLDSVETLAAKVSSYGKFGL